MMQSHFKNNIPLKTPSFIDDYDPSVLLHTDDNNNDNKEPEISKEEKISSSLPVATVDLPDLSTLLQKSNVQTSSSSWTVSSEKNPQFNNYSDSHTTPCIDVNKDNTSLTTFDTTRYITSSSSSEFLPSFQQRCGFSSPASAVATPSCAPYLAKSTAPLRCKTPCNETFPTTSSLLNQLLQDASKNELLGDNASVRLLLQQTHIMFMQVLKNLISNLSPDQITPLLSPLLFSRIVDRNTSIASFILKHLACSPDDALYFNQLLCQSPTNPYYLLKCLRVVADIATMGELPCHFLSRFISVAFQTCSSVREFFPQQQVARLICVFLLDLVQREKISANDDIAYEIQTFAVTWAQLKEAGLLFRALRSSSSP